MLQTSNTFSPVVTLDSIHELSENKSIFFLSIDTFHVKLDLNQ